MKSSPAITASSRPRFRATSSDSTPRPVTGGEDRGQVRRHEGARLAATAADGGPPVARQHPGGPFRGRALLAGEPGSEARRGHRRRRARRGSPLLVELGEVAGERRVLETPTREPGVEAADGAGVRPSGVRADGGRGEPPGGRRRTLELGRGGTGRGRRIHLHHRRRSIHVSPAAETRTSKRLMPGSSWRSGVIPTMRASTRRRPRPAGVSAGIRPMASSAIRNQTWPPAGSSSAPNQSVPFGSRVGLASGSAGRRASPHGGRR